MLISMYLFHFSRIMDIKINMRALLIILIFASNLGFAQDKFILYSKTGANSTNILSPQNHKLGYGVSQALALEYEYSQFVSFIAELGVYQSCFSDSAKRASTQSHLGGYFDIKLPLNRVIFSAGSGIGINGLLYKNDPVKAHYYITVDDKKRFVDAESFNKTHIDIFVNVTGKVRVTKKLYTGIQYRYNYSVNGFYSGADRYANTVSFLIGIKP